jgi:hypothetical protein
VAVRADRRLKVLVNADYSLALPIAKARASQVSKAALENFDLKTPAATGNIQQSDGLTTHPNAGVE